MKAHAVILALVTAGGCGHEPTAQNTEGGPGSATETDSGTTAPLPTGDGETEVDPTGSDDVWHHVALTSDHQTGTQQVFIDGTLSASGEGEQGVMTRGFHSLGRTDVTPNYFKGCSTASASTSSTPSAAPSIRLERMSPCGVGRGQPVAGLDIHAPCASATSCTWRPIATRGPLPTPRLRRRR